jgi:hypothetical protein
MSWRPAWKHGFSQATEDESAGVHRLIALGARKVTTHHVPETWMVMADPEGNEFCVLG